MKRTKMLTALTALMTLTACDKISKPEFARERASSTYRAAMNDYQAGRLSQALEGFKETCAADPANASARFQLACLLQDSVKDYEGAFCAYREYLLQCPTSEKAKLASDRLVVCERELARKLSDKYALNAPQDALRAVQEGRAARIKVESELAKTRAELEAANQHLDALRQENERLKKFMHDEADSGSAEFGPEEFSVAKAMVAEQEVEGEHTKKSDLAAAKQLAEEDDAEQPPLLKQDPRAKEKRLLQQQQEKAQRKPVDPYPHEKRPETYVIQDGDTLYKIAVRFYGRASAWQAIRNANRATISTDGRLRTGQKIVLPNIE